MSGSTIPPASHAPLFAGLTPEQVEASRREHGANVITPPPEKSWLALYREQFDDPVIRILIIAASVALIVGIFEGKFLEPLGIIVAIFLATFMAFYNSYKAQKEFKLLERESDNDPAKVIRAGNPTEVPRRDLVVGDIVIVETGDKLPADGRVLEAMSLQVDEAPLTGESEPVDKMAVEEADDDGSAGGAYPVNLVCRGVTVTDGHGVIEVTAVGDHTEIGKIAGAVSQEEPPTPLDIQLHKLSKLIGVLAFSIAAALFVALTVRGVLTGELGVRPQDWDFIAILCGSVLLALTPVWLPIVYDGLALLGRPARPPAWLGMGDGEGGEDGDDKGGSWRIWALSMGAAMLVFAGGIGIGLHVGFMPRSPADWLPAHTGEELLKYFMIAVTLIVVAVPEGLAMSVVMSLAYSTRRLLRDNNLVKRMHACETIGAATVICTDKTGTLTQSAMRVRDAQFPCLEGQRAIDRTDGLSEHELLIAEGIAVNSTGNLDRSADGQACAVGNPTDCALLLWLDEIGMDYLPHRLQFDTTFQLRFDPKRKYMGTMGVSPQPWGRVLHVKGAPEIVLTHCATVLTPHGPEPLNGLRPDIETTLRDYEERGMRCLGMAYRHEPGDGSIGPDGLAEDLTWVGFVAIEDPVRPDVPEAIEACKQAGIRVIVVTGDNPRTAREVGRQLGLWEDHDPPEACILGAEFEAMDAGRAHEVVARLKIMARARPHDKERLVELLQQQGEVVAVTGDGINDVPALHKAQVGLAMGSGTDAARDVSDIVIKDDSFASVATGVRWGRSLYQNIQRFVLFQLTINFVACGIALLGPFIGVKLPLTVIQMLWVNLIMDAFAALALATEPPHATVMQRPPRDPRQFIITPAMMRNILGVGAAFLLLLVGFLLHLQRHGDFSAYAPSRELTIFFTVFVMLQFWNLFNARCLGLVDSALWGLRGNPWFALIVVGIFAVQVLLVQFGGEVFRTVPLSAGDWLTIVAATSVVLWAGELWRFRGRRCARAV